MGLSFVITGEPMGKQRPRAQQLGRYIHIYTPQKTIDYENYIKLCYLDTNKDQAPYINGESLELRATIYQSIPRSTSKKRASMMLLGKIQPTKKPDIDNILKVILDSLNGLAFKDDTQVTSITAIKYYSNEPRVEVTINEIQEGTTCTATETTL